VSGRHRREQSIVIFEGSLVPTPQMRKEFPSRQCVDRRPPGGIGEDFDPELIEHLLPPGDRDVDPFLERQMRTGIVGPIWHRFSSNTSLVASIVVSVSMSVSFR